MIVFLLSNSFLLMLRDGCLFVPNCSSQGFGRGYPLGKAVTAPVQRAYGCDWGRGDNPNANLALSKFTPWQHAVPRGVKISFFACF